MIPTSLSRLRTSRGLLARATLIAAATLPHAAAAEEIPPLPEATTLLQRFVRAVGGETEIRRIDALSARGRIVLPRSDRSGTFSWKVADGNRCRFDMAFPQLGQRSFGSDGAVGWERVELDGAVHENELEVAEVERRRRHANWFELALTLPARATEFKTMGRVSFDSVPAFEVRMLDPNERVHHLFFDADSHLLLGVRLIEKGPLGPADVTIRFSEWKPVGPLQLFHLVSIDHADLHLQLEFESVSLDAIPASDFAPPELMPTEGQGRNE
ncbi:MAG: hypothetical protein QF561_00575 [Phycisphaerales bacterium]|jgi:hypothetical protein|nr:hypothetical protein [Phycisphaerales bacterium]